MFTLSEFNGAYHTFAEAVAVAHESAIEAMGEGIAIWREYQLVAVRQVGGAVIVIRPELVGPDGVVQFERSAKGATYLLLKQR